VGSRVSDGEAAEVSLATDEQLVEALRGGDMDSLAVLVGRWEQPLFRFVYRLLPRREDAHDVCQETFLRILKKSHRFRPGSRFSTWMYQIALNLCRDHVRRRQRWSLLIADREPPPPDSGPAPPDAAGIDPVDAVDRREKTAALRRALDDLPPEQREVLILKEFEGLKFREIAAILGCPESTVKSRMYYGLSGVRAALIRRGIAAP
jgi:RNA polymerase sigma-70 factor (ECF subfamily)